MKVVVFSDVHGYREWVDRILENNPDADYILSLGDFELEHEYLLSRDIVHVKGNSSHDPGFSYETVLRIEDVTIFLTHGHQYKVHRTLDKLIKHGVEHKYDLLLYGHTHVLHKQRTSGLWIANPGSIFNPRGQYPPSYLILEINGNQIEFTFKDVMTNRTLEV
jgi:putative phosphoesterase